MHSLKMNSIKFKSKEDQLWEVVQENKMTKEKTKLIIVEGGVLSIQDLTVTLTQLLRTCRKR